VNIRIGLLRALHASPRFKGRGRMIGTLTESFRGRPVRLPSGFLMALDPGEWIQQDILVKGSTEPLTQNLIGRLSSPGGCVVDVGAHVGLHALEAARAVGSGGRVLAFDPQPYNVDRIGRHAVLNGLYNILGFCAAVGDRDDFIKLPMQSERDRARLSLLGSSPSDEGAFVEVPIRRLDTVLDAHAINRVDVLKVDVEGYELEVLRGLGARINDCANVVLELLDDVDEERSRAVVDHLESAGFILKDMTGAPWRWRGPLVEGNLWAFRP
jgi:FkbM family methyltransferase